MTEYIKSLCNLKVDRLEIVAGEPTFFVTHGGLLFIIDLLVAYSCQVERVCIFTTDAYSYQIVAESWRLVL